MKRQKGAVMSEYVIITVFLSLVVLYALLGGDILKSTPGESPGVVKAVHDRGESFANQIYQP